MLSSRIVMSCTHPLPRSELRVRPKTGHIGVSARFRRNESSFGDEKCARNASALRVVFHSEVPMSVRGVRSKSGQRCENDTVLQLDVANLDGLEQFGFHFRRHCGWVAAAKEGVRDILECCLGESVTMGNNPREPFIHRRAPINSQVNSAQLHESESRRERHR